MPPLHLKRFCSDFYSFITVNTLEILAIIFVALEMLTLKEVLWRCWFLNVLLTVPEILTVSVVVLKPLHLKRSCSDMDFELCSLQF